MTPAPAAPTRTTPSTRDPERLGPYRIQERLADGGMGRLFLARDPLGDGEVVVKMLRTPWSGDPSAVARLRREARILADIDHDGVLRILDVFVHQGATVLVLPFVDGPSFRELLEAVRDGRPTPGPLDLDDCEAVLRTMEHVARAVHEVHRRGVVHRDLKPANLMLRSCGRPVVLDLGLATAPHPHDPKLTMEGQRVGTPPYMAPEQIRGEESRVGPATDVHSLCAVLFELCTGQRAFDGTTLQDVYEQVTAGAWDRESLEQSCCAELCRVLEKGLSFEPEQRYASAAELADDLRRVRRGETPLAARTPRGGWRRWLPWGRGRG